ncbi:hypothetical protein LB504_010679 [Fusarium proliferatum]|nr:hypothetical protein LB504_010679 [Fusarium proliferatum]
MSTVNADPVLHPDEQITDDGDSSIGTARLSIIMSRDSADETVERTIATKTELRSFVISNCRFLIASLEYHLPNDQVENEPLGDELGLAPPNDPAAKVGRVLDVIGVDLSPIQHAFVPPNVRFIIDDIDEDWEYGQPFDYIYSRMMVFSIKNWEDYIRKIFKHVSIPAFVRKTNLCSNLKPGGYVEFQETGGKIFSDGGTLTPDHALSKWCNLLLLGEAFMKLGSTSIEFDEIKAIMQEVGFIDVVDKRFKWPTNSWPRDKKFKELGTWNNYKASNALESLTMASFSRAHGWSKEEVITFLIGVRKDLNNPSIHSYNPICCIYGKKPDA